MATTIGNMADDNTYPGPDLSMADDDNQVPPIDNIHNIPPDAPAHPPFNPIPPSDPTGVLLADNTPPISASEPFLHPNAMPSGTRSTPSRLQNGTPETTTPMPSKAASHGAPARRYLNEKVTGTLLEGMRRLALEQPENPLLVLGEFLIQRSKELEGTGS